MWISRFDHVWNYAYWPDFHFEVLGTGLSALANDWYASKCGRKKKAVAVTHDWEHNAHSSNIVRMDFRCATGGFSAAVRLRTVSRTLCRDSAGPLRKSENQQASLPTNNVQREARVFALRTYFGVSGAGEEQLEYVHPIHRCLQVSPQY